MIAADRSASARTRAAARRRRRRRDPAPRRAPRCATLFEPGDLVVANDAATLPASLHGTHLRERRRRSRCGSPALARRPDDPTRFTAVVFGAGDYRTRTEDRPPPPPLAPGDRLALGPLVATRRARCSAILAWSRCVSWAAADAIWPGSPRHGRPIQYAHVPEPLALVGRVDPIAADPVAFEPPSAGFALDWRTLARWRRRGIGFATLTHAAGISSTGDPALDARLPFDEPYRIPSRPPPPSAMAKLSGGRVIAIGTTVVRALESAADAGGSSMPATASPAAASAPAPGSASSTRSSPACIGRAKATSNCCARSPTTRLLDRVTAELVRAPLPRPRVRRLRPRRARAKVRKCRPGKRRLRCCSNIPTPEVCV